MAGSRALRVRGTISRLWLYIRANGTRCHSVPRSRSIRSTPRRRDHHHAGDTWGYCSLHYPWRAPRSQYRPGFHSHILVPGFFFHPHKTCYNRSIRSTRSILFKYKKMNECVLNLPIQIMRKFHFCSQIFLEFTFETYLAKFPDLQESEEDTEKSLFILAERLKSECR